ncbi:MAG: erythronate-4-phosphate dehydrogenase, partial [Mariprofundales bacterium]|nr:erythronate-4-phosphate dehydrogenase [Mariprofundales bacterium]
MTELRVVADRHVWGVESAFAAFAGYDVDLHLVEQSMISRAAVADADALLVRSSTRVDAELLAGSRVRWVGTATVGSDHIDLDYLQQHGIAFASAAGSSTLSVVEYLTAVLFTLQCEYGVV